jgi:hypothetical protein
MRKKITIQTRNMTKYDIAEGPFDPEKPIAFVGVDEFAREVQKFASTPVQKQALYSLLNDVRLRYVTPEIYVRACADIIGLSIPVEFARKLSMDLQRSEDEFRRPFIGWTQIKQASTAGVANVAHTTHGTH